MSVPDDDNDGDASTSLLVREERVLGNGEVRESFREGKEKMVKREREVQHRGEMGKRRGKEDFWEGEGENGEERGMVGMKERVKQEDTERIGEERRSLEIFGKKPKRMAKNIE